jgi:hypothetical protein
MGLLITAFSDDLRTFVEPPGARGRNTLGRAPAPRLMPAPPVSLDPVRRAVRGWCRPEHTSTEVDEEAGAIVNPIRQ